MEIYHYNNVHIHEVDVSNEATLTVLLSAVSTSSSTKEVEMIAITATDTLDNSEITAYFSKEEAKELIDALTNLIKNR